MLGRDNVCLGFCELAIGIFDPLWRRLERKRDYEFTASGSQGCWLLCCWSVKSGAIYH